MELMEAIYHRRSVRAYTTTPVEHATVCTLIDAAVQAPSAMNAQPWAFAVVHGSERLQQYATRAKCHLLETLDPHSPLAQYRDHLADPHFALLYQAPALVVICATSDRQEAVGDCFLAAQNLMLAAYGLGLGTCVIGLAVPWLQLAEVKQELGIPAHYTPVLPIIVGIPQGDTPPVAKRAPEVFVVGHP